MDTLNYGRLMQKAMRGLVAEVLGLVAEHGLPGEHHFYITFQTNCPGVDMPDWLRARFPDEMVVVMQHEYRDLTVLDDRFSVTLSFNDKPATLVVPFDAVLQFADPSAEFGLRFDGGGPAEEEEAEDDDGATLRRRATSSNDGGRAGDGSGAKTGEVVQLDTFRKK